MSDPASETQQDASARRREQRRRALTQLATEVRRLIDAAVNADVELAEIEDVAAASAALAERLRQRAHPGPYSGLVGPDGLDSNDPARAMPLSPWAGACNPISPPVALRYEGDKVFGAVRLGKAYVGPPGVAHGGVVAGLMDQILAAAGQLAGVGGVTGKMTVHFRKPTPLGQDLTLIAWAEPGTSHRRRVRAELRAGDVLTAEGEAIVVRVARLSAPEKR